MNPYEILNIDPTNDKMAIRRAYVRETKRHHPDHGGDPVHFEKIQTAYYGLIQNKNIDKAIETEVNLSLKDLLHGCVAQAIIIAEPNKVMMIEFTVPPYTYPGTYIEFRDKTSTRQKIRVKVHESVSEEYNRLDSNIVIKKQINIFDALVGTCIDVTNFDSNIFNVSVSPKTTADRLIYNFQGAGFFDKKTRMRGNLTIIVEIQRKGN